MTATTATEVVNMPIALLHAHPRNTHGKLRKDHPKVLELKASIAANGQNEPCIVRPNAKGHEILSGHIRTFAQELLGAVTVPCIVRDVDDEQALTIVLTSNEKEPVDPLLEADAIAELLAKNAGDLRAVAKKLGKSVRHVALRSNLCTLSAKVRKLWQDGQLEAWTVSMLEDLARLAPAAQDELANTKNEWQKLEKQRDQEDLDNLIGDRFQELGKATWKLDDATLCPKAGACTTCPKTSLRSPGLFDDGDADPTDPAALKKAICRDAACWSEKAMAVAKAAIASAKKEAGGDLLVVKKHGAPVPKGVKALETWQASEVKKGTKGAKPAAIIDEDGRVTQGFAMPPRAPSKPKTSSSSPGKAKKPAAPKPGDKNFAEKLEASKKEIAKRRASALDNAIYEAIGEMQNKPAGKLSMAVEADTIEALVVAFGAMGPGYCGARGEVEIAERKRLFDLAKFKGAATTWAKELLPRVLECVAEDVGYGQNPELSLWVARVLGIDLEQLQAKVEKEIPDPEWWGPAKAEDLGDRAAKKPTKKKAKA